MTTAPMPKAAARPAPTPAASRDASAVPTVSIEDLPRESRKKTSGAKSAPQKASDPFARRR
jgi:hypothetical protein